MLTKNGDGDLVVMDKKDRQFIKAQQLVLESIFSRLFKDKTLSVEESKDKAKAMLEGK